MFVKRLNLSQFRIYETLELIPSGGVNILVGDNAQGKSAILEALYLLSTSKSFRCTHDSEMIWHQAPEELNAASVSAEVIRSRQNDLLIDVQILPMDKKAVRLNGVKKSRIVDLLGQLNTVLFCAMDLGIVSADPGFRRRYLNIELSQISPKYIIDMAGYKKALEQRNRLLKDLRDYGNSDPGVLEAWNNQLVQFGAPIIDKRQEYIERISPIADGIHQELTEGKETLRVEYLPSVTPTGSDSVINMENAIAEVRNEERRRGVTLIGPQRDDMRFMINDLDAKSYGSQGQQRTVALSLKLAEFQLISEYSGEPPVVLLDDVFSDLDDKRRTQLISRIFGKGQTFITCTELHAFGEKTLAGASIFRVDKGKMSVEQSGE